MGGAVEDGRVSDRGRLRALSQLRARWIEGKIGLETFEFRVAEVYAARNGSEVRALLADVAEPPRWELAARRAATVWRSATAPAAPAPPARVPGIPLALVREPVLVGRSRTCDVILVRDSVSRCHLELRRDGGDWVVTDLDSLNGTWLNGRRVGRARVARGDELILGDAPLLLE